MREAPRQPKNPDPIDESGLGFLGHRIESWQQLLDTSIPLQERKLHFVRNTRKELLALASDGGRFTPEEQTLIADLNDLVLSSRDETALASLCQEKVNYYVEQRHKFIQEI